MKTVNIHEAKTSLSALLVEVENQSEHIIICRYGNPVAEIIPYKKKKRSQVKKSLKPISLDCDLTEPSSSDWSLE
jgi:antitoxin (DNA-binding transcriptional repressor) of toxin-antitoxin stability system